MNEHDIQAECEAGYRDGRDLDAPAPGKNRSAAYRHGWIAGRDDREVSAGIRAVPSRSAEQARVNWRLIVAGVLP